jgi:hypothetical protein
LSVSSPLSFKDLCSPARISSIAFEKWVMMPSSPRDHLGRHTAFLAIYASHTIYEEHHNPPYGYILEPPRLPGVVGRTFLTAASAEAFATFSRSYGHFKARTITRANIFFRGVNKTLEFFDAI